MTTGFIGANLRTARLFHGLSLSELGDDIERSKQFLSRLESGVDAPTPALAELLAERLAVMPEFFLRPDPMPITDEQCHFRKQLTTKVALRQVARARGEMLKSLVNVLDEVLDLPRYDFIEGDPLDAERIEQLAEQCRAHWGLGGGPIQSMTRIAENAGAVVMPIGGLAQEIDAISFATRRPVIATNADGRSACRLRFGLAHEIGHFSLHCGVLTGDKLTETQANRFASAFLMPRRYFASECQRTLRGSRFNWQAMSETKIRWGVSKAAILYRGRQLGVFSEEQYRSGVIFLNRHSEARREIEDAEMALEPPEVIPDGLHVLREQLGMPISAIARRMNVQPSLVDDLLVKGHTSQPDVRAENVIAFPSSR